MFIFQKDYATSWEAHLAGAVTGILLGIVILKNRRVEKWETWLKLVCVLSYTAGITVMITANIFGSKCNEKLKCYFKDEFETHQMYYLNITNNRSNENCTWY